MDIAGAIECNDTGHNIVEELAIVTYQEQGPFVAADQLFQKLERFGIQVVCRFVEDQEVRWLLEEPGQKQSISLSA